MIKVHNKKIYIVRGDTGPLYINLSQEVDNAIFSVKKNINDTDYVLQKEITGGMVKFKHEDTNNLETGEYVYDIQVEYGDDIDTPIIGTFTVIADVTRE